MNTCVVVGCVFNYEKTRKRDATGNLLSSVNDTTDIEQRTGIFHFPKSDDLKQKWNKFVSRKDWEPTNNSVICSGHFESKYLIHGMGKQRVRLNFELDPFPTIYPAGHIPQTSTLPSASSKIPRKASTDRSTPDFKSLDDSICPNGFTFQKFDNHVVYFRLVFSKYFVPEVIESIVIDKGDTTLASDAPLPLPRELSRAGQLVWRTKSMADVNRGNRPLSPHLSIYRPQLTSVTSILTRITGNALLLASLMIVWWFLAAAISPEYFAFADWMITSMLGDLIMILSVWALWYHALAGIRHLIWDNAMMLDIPTAEKLGWAVVVGSFVLTVLTALAV